MFGSRFAKGAAVSLATLGLFLPQSPLQADPAPARPAASKPANVTQIPDIVLTDGGTLSGRVCDRSGKVIEGAKVTLKQDKKVIQTTTTDKDGVYSFKGLKGGVYNPSSGNTEGVFRAWSQKSAPPSAKEHALLVMGENGARGQFGAASPALVVSAVGAIAVTTISLVNANQINNLNNKVDDLQNKLASP